MEGPTGTAARPDRTVETVGSDGRVASVGGNSFDVADIFAANAAPAAPWIQRHRPE